ncbi:transposase [Alteribacillus sp. JSM 102045]|uniref:transposase n=1 Tax=Alteribacillus sp. JSM 102045 TaxID=1562101 RepID=UPI0035C20C0B
MALLEELNADAVRSWLKKHKNIKIVSWDGSLLFKQAIQESDGKVMQLTDRWHLNHNFNERMERILSQIVGSRIPIHHNEAQHNQEPE